MRDYSRKSLVKAFVPPKSVRWATLAILLIWVIGFILCQLSIMVGCFIVVFGVVLLPLAFLPYIIWLGITTIRDVLDGAESVMKGITAEQKKRKQTKK
jgi:hypothetical protein